MPLSRRDFLGGALGAALLPGCSREEVDLPPSVSFQGGERLGVLDWDEDDPPEFGKKLGRGWDGRRFYDLKRVSESHRVTPTPDFFLRTFAPDTAHSGFLDFEGADGGVRRIAIASLRPRPMGAVLIECAGNDASAAFGLMGSARWQGVPLETLIEDAPAGSEPAWLQVSGVDSHSAPSLGGHSKPGASWIFSLDELLSSGAFLATHMNEARLAADHGAPLRLVIPGWYGCTWIKWVERLSWVRPDAPATSQMREFASRTHQRGVPERARDYAPARVDAAALPVRVERWRVGGRTLLRVVGVAWGEAAAAGELQIRLGRKERWQRVEIAGGGDEHGWQVWDHPWEPSDHGRFLLRCRFGEPAPRQRRMRAGFYQRAIRL